MIMTKRFLSYYFSRLCVSGRLSSSIVYSSIIYLFYFMQRVMKIKSIKSHEILFQYDKRLTKIKFQSLMFGLSKECFTWALILVWIDFAYQSVLHQ